MNRDNLIIIFIKLLHHIEVRDSFDEKYKDKIKSYSEKIHHWEQILNNNVGIWDYKEENPNLKVCELVERESLTTNNYLQSYQLDWALGNKNLVRLKGKPSPLLYNFRLDITDLKDNTTLFTKVFNKSWSLEDIIKVHKLI